MGGSGDDRIATHQDLADLQKSITQKFELFDDKIEGFKKNFDFQFEVFQDVNKQRLDGHGKNLDNIWTAIEAFKKEHANFCFSLLKEQNEMNREILEKLHALEKKVDRKADRRSHDGNGEVQRSSRTIKIIGVGSAVSAAIVGIQQLISFFTKMPPPSAPAH